MAFNPRESLFRMWYWYVSKVDKNAEILFMNYGYNDSKLDVSIEKHHEHNRYPIQLYHHLAHEIEIKNKDIVEIGSGRGGGLSYITQTFSPSTAKGVDLNKKAIEFCNKHYKQEGLSFIQGDAQRLGLQSESCDVVLNVESSHRYPDVSAFLNEVSRILRPNGYFLFTDFRYDHEMDELKRELEKCGLSIQKERIINSNVVEALNMDNERRQTLVKKMVPRLLHKIALNFAGAVGSETYNQFLSEKYIYFSYVLQKVN